MGIDFRRLVITIATTNFLSTACATKQPLFQEVTATSIQDAGTIHVAVASVIARQEIKYELSSNFQLTEDQALEKVLPVTQRVMSKFLDALDVSLGINPKQTATTKNTTETATSSSHPPDTPGTNPNNGANGTETISSTTTITRTTQPGAVPAVNPNPSSLGTASGIALDNSGAILQMVLVSLRHYGRALGSRVANPRSPRTASL
jgi:hypothetical protein